MLYLGEVVGRGVGVGVGAPYYNLYGEVLPNRVHLSIQDRLFHVLFFFVIF